MEKLPQLRVVENQKVRALHYLKARVKEKEMIVLTPPPPLGGKGGESKKGNSKTKPALTQGKAGESAPKSSPPMGSTPASASSNNPVTPSPKAGVSKPGKIPRQCAYFESSGGCTRGDKCVLA